MKILALIPARQGSKSIPNKNILEFKGKPLLVHAIECAKASQVADRILLSSDSEEYLDIGNKSGAQTSLRPSQLAGDTTSMQEVIQYELARLKKEGYVPDAVLLLQPTQPLRTAQHLQLAVEMLQQNAKVDSVVSVVEVPKHFSPQFVMKIEDGFLKFFDDSGPRITRRQDVQLVYSRDGTCYLFRTQSFYRTQSIYGENSLPLKIPIQQSINLDDPYDWNLMKVLHDT